MLSPSLLASLATAALLFDSVRSQTWSACNPTLGNQCPPDPALGRSITTDFTSGAGEGYTAVGNVAYSSNGAAFTVAKSGDSPQLNSKWYFMFGRFEITMKAAPGTGIVSSAVLQSDDLDEIDWEFVGGSPNEVQSNYFGKGVASTGGRGAFHAVSGTQTQYRTYTIDWTAQRIVWQIDGQTVRVLNYNDAGGQYPQTPMQVKFGVWAGGDSSNQAGTIQWAGGPTDYSKGPFTMLVKSVSVSDYSTGTQYQYTGTSGTWQSINAVGGKVNGDGGSSNTQVASPAITSTSSGGPSWQGTHRSQTTPDPSLNTNYPGLPAGWTVSSSGKVIPPANPAPIPPPSPSPSPSPPPSPPASCADPAGVEAVPGFDSNGAPTTLLVASGPRRYDDRGFLITAAPVCTGTPPAAGDAGSGSLLVRSKTQTVPNNSTLPPHATANMAGALRPGWSGRGLGLACVVAVGAMAAWL